MYLHTNINSLVGRVNLQKSESCTAHSTEKWATHRSQHP